jgi:hypothetical protein
MRIAPTPVTTGEADRTERTIDTRRAGRFGLMLLLLATAVPTCLLMAAPVMASTMDHSGDCDPTDASTGMCQYHDTMQSPAVSTWDSPGPASLPAVVAPPLRPAVSGLAASPSESARGTPATAPVPLRL